MPPRRLTDSQQEVATEALRFVQPCIAAFCKGNPDLRQAIARVDMDGVANLAVCQAAFTYDPAKSAKSTYFGSAIRHALYRAVLGQQRHDGRYIAVERIVDPVPNRHRTRSEHRAFRALRMLNAYDRTLLEDRLIEQVTLEQLASEQRCDPRTVGKRVKKAIEKLRLAEGELP